MFRQLVFKLLLDFGQWIVGVDGDIPQEAPRESLSRLRYHPVSRLVVRPDAEHAADGKRLDAAAIHPLHQAGRIAARDIELHPMAQVPVGIDHQFIQRQSLVKLVFNLTLFWVESCVAPSRATVLFSVVVLVSGRSCRRTLVHPVVTASAATSSAAIREIKVIISSPREPDRKFPRPALGKPDREIDTHDSKQGGQEGIYSNLIPG